MGAKGTGRGICSWCREKLTSENSTPAILKRGHGFCRTCGKRYNYERYKYDPGKLRFKRLGQTQEQFEVKFSEQNSLCEICKKPMVLGVFAAANLACQDHDHKTKRLRDILCNRCNLMIGHCLEDKNILASAIQYLQKHENSSTTQTVPWGTAGINPAF